MARKSSWLTHTPPPYTSPLRMIFKTDGRYGRDPPKVRGTLPAPREGGSQKNTKALPNMFRTSTRPKEAREYTPLPIGGGGWGGRTQPRGGRALIKKKPASSIDPWHNRREAAGREKGRSKRLSSSMRKALLISTPKWEENMWNDRYNCNVGKMQGVSCRCGVDIYSRL